MAAIKKKLVDNDSLSVLCAELCEILRSGITVGEGFSLISEQERDRELKALYAALYENTVDGGSVSNAMRESAAFPEYMLRMIGVAEETGALEGVLSELSEHYRRQARLRRTIRAAVGYPLLLLGIVLVVFFVFLTEVLPVFDRVFAQIGARMMPVAEAFLNFGIWLAGAKWAILAVLAALALTALVIALVPSLRARVSAAFSRLFSKGATGRKISAARIASVVALAVTGASDIGEALQISCEFAEGFDSNAKLALCSRRVEAGESFSAAALETGLFEPAYCRMLAIGERTGSTERMMRDVASRAQEDMEVAVDRLTGRVEPIAVIILSLCVGLLLLSVMLPLVGIMSAL
ncbi:MAG: type II secretion system F family protein [Oscillospiraceae bacterium]